MGNARQESGRSRPTEQSLQMQRVLANAELSDVAIPRDTVAARFTRYGLGRRPVTLPPMPPLPPRRDVFSSGIGAGQPARKTISPVALHSSNPTPLGRVYLHSANGAKISIAPPSWETCMEHTDGSFTFEPQCKAGLPPVSAIAAVPHDGRGRRSFTRKASLPFRSQRGAEPKLLPPRS